MLIRVKTFHILKVTLLKVNTLDIYRNIIEDINYIKILIPKDDFPTNM